MLNPLSILDTHSPPTHSAASSDSEQFLRFHLLPNTTVLLPVLQLTEVLKIPKGQIVPIPSMPAWVMGVYNWRGEILWIVDLGHLVGLTPWYQQASSAPVHMAVVLNGCSSNARSNNAKSQMLGLVVNRIENIEWCNLDLIESPPSSTVTPELLQFLRGYWLKSNGEMLAILDGKSIIEAMGNG